MRRERFDVDFKLVKNAPPTLALSSDDDDDDDVIDVGSWDADVIAEYVRSKVTPRGASPADRSEL